MNRVFRLGLILSLATLVATFADSRAVLAQGLNIRALNQNSNRSDDDEERDDDDDNDNQNSQGQQGGSRRSQSTNKNVQQFQQFFQGGQGAQGQSGQGQGGTQFRRSANQGQFQQGQFQQGQFPQGQQFQNWQQGNQGSLKLGNWQSGKWQGTRKIDNWMQTFGGNQQPFSTQWYQDHPKAWKYDNNKTSIWVGGTLPGVYAWLGWGNVPPQYQAYYGNVPQFNHEHYGDWYPLGVFSLMAGPGDPGTRIVQLAVDQHGHVAGNYYDMITNSAYNVSGDIRQQSQRVSWSLNKNQFVRFRAPLFQLLQPYGTLSVQLPGGEQQWQFVRLEN